MEFFGALIILGLIGLILVGSVMGIIANSRIGRLEGQIKLLTRRLEAFTSGDRVFQAKGSTLQAKPATLKAAAKTKTESARSKDAEAPISQNPHTAKPISIAPKSKPRQNPRTQSPKKPKWSFEEEIGARWTVWVGGIALLLGAVFLLRYTIEAGFFTPQMRVLMAGVMGAGLLGAGEWLRRHDVLPVKSDIKRPALLENSYIPGILTAVGIFTLLGTVYAAYELYGFIGPIIAFGLMALISLGALALGLLHGPWLSALGLVASFATPLLIQTEAPNVYALFGYLSIISMVAWTLAKFRNWGWLDLATFAGGLYWLYMAHDATQNASHFWIWLGFFALTFAASTYIAGRPKTANRQLGEIPLAHTPITATGVSALLVIALLSAFSNADHGFMQEAVIAVTFVLALVVTAFYRASLIGNFLVATLFCATYFVIAIPYNQNIAESYGVGLIFASIIGGGMFQILRRPNSVNSKFSPYLGAFSPPILLWIAENTTEVNQYFTPAIAFIMAILLIFASSRLRQVRDDQIHEFSPYPWAAAFAYWLGVVTLTSGLLESLGLIAGIVIFAALYARLKWISLRWVSFAFAIIALAQILYLTIPVTNALSPTLILNELWIYLALPAVISYAAAWFFEKGVRDLPSEGLKAIALIFAALFFVYQIRHAMNGGVITIGEFSFDELALHVVTGLCFTLGGVALNIPAINHTKGVAKSTGVSMQIIPVLLTAISYLTLAVFVLGLCFIFAPLLNDNINIKGGIVFNTLILAYALPTILMALIIYLGQKKRPEHYIKLLGGLTALGSLFYLTSQIRRIYSGPEISIFDHFPEGFETYTISASWLVLGIILLFAGLKLGSRSLRVASAVTICLTVLKAFFIDMATLEGVLRAVSFVILGLVLIVIGRVYQRVLFNPKTIATSNL